MNPAADSRHPVSIKSPSVMVNESEDYLIRILKSGGGVMFAEPAELLTPGTALLLPPGATVRYALPLGGDFLDFHFDRDTAGLMQKNAPLFGGRNLWIVPQKTLPEMIRLAGELDAERRRRKPGYRLAMLEKILTADRLLLVA